jgi:hypothetical protein
MPLILRAFTLPLFINLNNRQFTFLTARRPFGLFTNLRIEEKSAQATKEHHTSHIINAGYSEDSL